jgi:orotidine-5'-phosphate decarboxylase
MLVEAKFFGMVCSGYEAQIVRQHSQYNNLQLICPGFRLHTSKEDDQTRIITPQNVVDLGVDYLVVGRPITKSSDPRKSGLAILKTITVHKKTQFANLKVLHHM